MAITVATFYYIYLLMNVDKFGDVDGQPCYFSTWKCTMIMKKKKKMMTTMTTNFTVNNNNKYAFV